MNLIKLLIENGADLNIRDGASEMTPLWFALEAEKLEVAKTIIEACPTCLNEIKDENNNPPMAIALNEGGNKEMLKLILEHYTDPDDIHINQRLLNQCIISDDIASVRLMLEEFPKYNQSLNLNFIDKYSQAYPLYVAAHSQAKKSLDFLIPQTSDINKKIDIGISHYLLQQLPIQTATLWKD